jgi:G patch domain-containing protein 1
MASYVKYGTPLVDSERRDLVQRQWGKKDDQVKDRFYGAFTGGFSAGYHNTVGSKEGWAPSTFKATRDGRNESSRVNRKEDFMDEEDLADLEDRIKLEPIYDILDSPSSGDPIYRTLRPTLNGIGYAILHKMGWKEGQGIGPKASKEVFVGDKRKSVEIAPKEEQEDMIQIESNVKCHGLGYGVDNTVLTPVSQTSVKRQRKQQSAQKRLPMNLSISADYEDDEEEGDLPSSKPLPKPVKTSVKFKRPTNSQRLITSGKAVTACKDGNPPLQGFVLRSEPIYKPSRYPRIQVPEEFIQNLKQNTSHSVSASPTSQLTPAQRAKLLSEEALPERSIFSFISSEQRDRLAKITGKSDLSEYEGAIMQEEKEKEEKKPIFASDIPKLSSEVAERVYQSQLRPYQTQKDKYDRYLTYLRSQMGQDPTLLNEPASNMRRSWIQELNEFSQVAQNFRKEQASFNGRFTYASSSGPKQSTAAKAPTRKSEEVAAERHEYGPQTRTVDSFHPERLLCKRFNVPYKGVRDVSQTQHPQQATPQETSAPDQEVDPTRNPILEAPRAPKDLFQLVFGHESDEEL